MIKRKMAGRKFNYFIDSNKETAIKEEFATRINTKNEKIYNITLGLDKSLELVKPYIVNENILEISDNPMIRPRKIGKNSLYFPLKLISYICEVQFILKENDDFEEKLSIYIPRRIIDNKYIHFDKVTSSFKEKTQLEIINKIKRFAVSRVSETVTKNGIPKEKVNLILNS